MTYEITPYVISALGVMVFPCSSTAWSMVSVWRIDEMIMKSEASAKWRPGQIL